MVKELLAAARETANTGPPKDQFVKSEHVSSLTIDNFQSYIKDKDVALVMFYILGNKSCEWSKKHFSKAAKKTMRPSHAYAAVDCVPEFELCVKEEVKNFPYYKMYSKGKEIPIIKDHKKFLYKDMKCYMETYGS